MNKKMRVRENRLALAVAHGYDNWNDYQLKVIGSKQEVKTRKTQEK